MTSRSKNVRIRPSNGNSSSSEEEEEIPKIRTVKSSFKTKIKPQREPSPEEKGNATGIIVSKNRVIRPVREQSPPEHKASSKSSKAQVDSSSSEEEEPVVPIRKSSSSLKLSSTTVKPSSSVVKPSATIKPVVTAKPSSNVIKPSSSVKSIGKPTKKVASSSEDEDEIVIIAPSNRSKSTVVIHKPVKKEVSLPVPIRPSIGSKIRLPLTTPPSTSILKPVELVEEEGVSSVKIPKEEKVAIPIKKKTPPSSKEEGTFSLADVKGAANKLKEYVKVANEGYDFYPLVKELTYQVGVSAKQWYEDFMNAPTNPIISNLSYGFLQSFLPGFQILLRNIARLGGNQLAVYFLTSIGFAEGRLLALVGLGPDLESNIKKVLRLFIEVSNPMGWGILLYRLAQASTELFSFLDEGGLLGDLDLLKVSPPSKDESILDSISRKATSETNKFIYRSLRLTLKSLIDDLSSFIANDNMQYIVNKLLSLYILGVNEGSINKERVQTPSPLSKGVMRQASDKISEYIRPITTKLSEVAAPLNKQAGEIISAAAIQELETFIINTEFKLEDAFPTDSLALIDEKGHHLELEEEFQMALQGMGSIAGAQMLRLMAEYAQSILGEEHTVEELLSSPVGLTFVQRMARSGVSYLANFFRTHKDT